MLDLRFDVMVKWFDAHPVLFGLSLLVMAVLAALLIDLIFRRLIVRITKRTATDLDDKIAKRIHRPLQATVFLVVCSFAIKILFEEHPAIDRSMDLVFSVIVVWWVWSLIQAFRLLFRTLINRRRTDATWVQMLPLLDNLVTIILVATGVFMLLNRWQVNITPLLASAGIVTAAFALASKDTLANFFGGVSIFMDRPYRLGDFILLDTGERGEVVDIGVRSTRLKTRDDVLVTIPNAQMANATIVNETQPAPRYRCRVKVGVSYDSDPNQVEKVLLACIKDIPEILQFPNPRVRFRSFGESSLDFELLAWVRDPQDRGRIVHNMNFRIFYAFQEAGIEIPFPQRVVHMAPDAKDKPKRPKAEPAQAKAEERESAHDYGFDD